MKAFTVARYLWLLAAVLVVRESWAQYVDFSEYMIGTLQALGAGMLVLIFHWSRNSHERQLTQALNRVCYASEVGSEPWTIANDALVKHDEVNWK